MPSLILNLENYFHSIRLGRHEGAMAAPTETSAGPACRCPLSHVRMQEPMLAIDCGHHFDRAAVEAGIQRAGGGGWPGPPRPPPSESGPG